MNRIRLLSEDVYSRIAAGEVIERPASVVRELLDNSIDANSTEITVIVKNAGIEEITVIDNGDGILKEDIPLALQCHATSKIEKISDLYKIDTMGFRGEALYSIQKIAKITISSNTDPSGLTPGYKISNSQKDFIIENIPFKKGTKVQVYDLFYNLPVRKRFLKSKITELNQIKKVVIDKSLANLNIKFKLISDNKIIFSTDGDNNFKNTFFKIYDENKFEIFEYEEKIDSDLTIKIYHSDMNIYFPTRKYMDLFVNKRNVNVNFFYSAVDTGIRNYISQSRYPLLYVFITIDPSFIDINIHPAKKEIKFFDQQKIFSLIKESVSKAFTNIIKDQIKPSISLTSFEKKEILQKDIFDNLQNQNIEKRIEINNFIENKTQNIDNQYKIVGVVFETYIIIEKQDELLFIDQHAAMEAILYHRKKEQYIKKATSEKLLIPIIITLNKWDDKIEENLEKLNSCGFLIEHNEATTITVREIPLIFLTKDYNIISETIEEFIISKEEKKDIVEEILISASCKEAVKKGDRLTLNEIFELVELYFKYNITNCPHGRPVQFRLDKNSLEKAFQRKM